MARISVTVDGTAYEVRYAGDPVAVVVASDRCAAADALLTDYSVPSAADLPDFVTDRNETPATSNPLGVKRVVDEHLSAVVRGAADA